MNLPRPTKARAAIGLGGVALVAVAVVVLWRQLQPEPTISLVPQDSAVVALGQSIYAEQCASCHGVNLEGQPDWRRRLPNGRLPAPPHDESGHTWHHTDDVLFAITRYGVEAFAPAGYESDMPAYEGVLTDDEIIAVLSYIKSTWPEEIQRRHDQMNAARP